LCAALFAAAACSESNNATNPGGGGDTTGTGKDTLGCRSTDPDSGVTVGTVVTDSFASTSLGVLKHYLVYLPPSYAKSTQRKYPVAYYLHGTEATERSWIDQMQLATTLDTLAVKAKTPEMIVVMPDGDDSFWHNWDRTPDYQTCLNNVGPIGYCVQTANYGDYVASDLVRHIDSTYRTLTDSVHRGVAGLSMGGAGAIYLALAYPKVFGAAAALSPAILTWLNVGGPPDGVMASDTSQIHTFLGPEWDDYKIYDQFNANLSTWALSDPYSMAVARAGAGTPFPPIWISVGTDDGEALVGSQIFHNKLTHLGIAHTYIEVPGAAHTVDFWTTHAGAASAWLQGQLNPCPRAN